MPSDLTKFGLSEMLRCSTELRRATKAVPTMEEAAQRVCRALYDELVTSDGSRACALVRCYKTHPYGRLEPDVQTFARAALHGTRPIPSMRCLILLGTAGDEPAWNSRRTSVEHRAIPLPSAEMIERAPMIAQLIRQFGLDLTDVVQPTTDLVRSLDGKTYGVFHVPEAVGSPHIPAQKDFVLKFGIRSVVELIKAIVKLAIVGSAVYFSLGRAWSDLLALPQQPPPSRLQHVRGARFGLRQLGSQPIGSGQQCRALHRLGIGPIALDCLPQAADGVFDRRLVLASEPNLDIRLVLAVSLLLSQGGRRERRQCHQHCNRDGHNESLEAPSSTPMSVEHVTPPF
jgi:hypothetical protein